MSTARERNHVVVTGSGAKTLVFTHGFGCNQDEWADIAPHFEREYRVVRYDLTGYGSSQVHEYDRERHASLQGHATDLIEILHELEATKVRFVGHSAGGMIGVLAAIREPKLFERLALVAASPCYFDQADYIGGAPRPQIEHVLGMLENDYLGWCDAIVPAAMANADRPELARSLVATFKRAPAEIAKHFGRAIFLSDVRTALPFLSAPTLVVQTREDIFVPESVGRFIAGHVQNGKLHLLRATGHFPQRSGPDELVAVLKTWAA